MFIFLINCGERASYLSLNQPSLPSSRSPSPQNLFRATNILNCYTYHCVNASGLVRGVAREKRVYFPSTLPLVSERIFVLCFLPVAHTHTHTAFWPTFFACAWSRMSFRLTLPDVTWEKENISSFLFICVPIVGEALGNWAVWISSTTSSHRRNENKYFSSSNQWLCIVDFKNWSWSFARFSVVPFYKNLI